MANYDFLNSPVIPGTEPAAKHVHHRSMVTFIVLAIVIIVGACVYYFSMNQNATTVSAPAVVDQRTQMINQALATLKGAQPASQAEVQDALKQLSKSKPVRATQAQIDQALSQLKTK